MEVKRTILNFINGIADQEAAIALWSLEYPHTDADYYWLDLRGKINGWIDHNPSCRSNWILIKKEEIEKYHYLPESVEFYRMSYAAPTSEQVLFWKLKNGV
jgi:hypothetical protein